MKTSLYAYEVITTKEQNIIDNKIGCEKMEYLIVKIIIPSLEQRHGKKYKSFLKAMEDSEDTDLQDTAKMLGMLILVMPRYEIFLSQYDIMFTTIYTLYSIN